MASEDDRLTREQIVLAVFPVIVKSVLDYCQDNPKGTEASIEMAREAGLTGKDAVNRYMARAAAILADTMLLELYGE